MGGTTTVLVLVVALISFGFGLAAHRWLLRRSARKYDDAASRKADRILADAQEEADAYRTTAFQEAKLALHKERTALNNEREESKRSLQRSRKKLERRHDRLNNRTQQLNNRETVLHDASGAIDTLRREAERTQRQAEDIRSHADKVLQEASARRSALHAREQEVAQREEGVSATGVKVAQLIKEHSRRLEQVAGLTAQEAREALREQLIDEARLEASSHIKDVRDEAKLTANREARKVIITAIQRTAASHSIENTVSVVNIQSDEMKGRIIGREGRNIRAFEAATGIEVIVDDTPGAVVLSGFDPVRREIARIALSKLVQDGRIHPGSIEKVVRKVSGNMDEEIIEIGERTVIDLQLHGLHPELIRVIGRMRYRTSYGQNLLSHSIETAQIASLISAEIGLDTSLARRAGLLHDIGKVIPESVDRPHAIVGMDICKRYREEPSVCNAVGAHHDEIEMTALISPIVQASDAISGARPGARREALQEYIKRLEQLEALAASFDGVERAFAFQAGREIRVMVNHDHVSDDGAGNLALDISKRIQHEMRYPGQIKVTVIREVRSTAYAT